MSERIKELRDRAVVLACLSYEEQTTQTFADNKSFQQILSEKFAELIVRECAQVIRDCKKYGCHLPLEFEVMEHFGVEE